MQADMTCVHEVWHGYSSIGLCGKPGKPEPAMRDRFDYMMREIVQEPNQTWGKSIEGPYCGIHSSSRKAARSAAKEQAAYTERKEREASIASAKARAEAKVTDAVRIVQQHLGSARGAETDSVALDALSTLENMALDAVRRPR